MAASPAVSAGRIAKTDALRHGQALFALGGCDCAVHGATRLHHCQYRGSGNGGEPACHTAESEGGRDQLHPEPGGLHPGQWMDRGSVWFGTRRVFGIAVAIFTFASVLCGLSVNVPMLVAARILQGMGAAMMMPVGRLPVIRTFPKSELLMAMNFVIIPALIGPLLGPTVGGLIVHWLSWRDIFFVNVTVGLMALLLIHRHMPDYHGDKPRPLDVVGACPVRRGHRTAVVAAGGIR